MQGWALFVYLKNLQCYCCYYNCRLFALILNESPHCWYQLVSLQSLELESKGVKNNIVYFRVGTKLSFLH